MTIRNRGPSEFRRDAWLEIDLGAIEHNIRQFRSLLSPGTQLMAVVKSDAYGHGSQVIGPFLEACGVERMAVASVDEGVYLRQAGVKVPILVLSTAPLWSYERACEHDLEITVTSREQLRQISARTVPTPVQVEIDTGMHRSGASLAEARQLLEEILSDPGKYQLRGVYSHLANAATDGFSEEQFRSFMELTGSFPPGSLGIVHIGASGALAREDMHLDTVRVGISLYGLAEPVAGMSLLPAMTLQARLVQRRWLAPGEGVGYGLAWRSGRDSLVGLVPVGYADGLKRGLSGRIEGYLRGARVPQIGTISMDQASFDLTDTGGDVGETMEILGPNSMSISDWARILGSIPYEVACDLRTRLPRVYVRS